MSEEQTPSTDTPSTPASNDSDKLSSIQNTLDDIGKKFSEKIEEVERRLGVLESEKTHESVHSDTTDGTGTASRETSTGTDREETASETHTTKKDSEPRRQHWYDRKLW